MTHISPAAAAAREHARTVTGEFGRQQHSAPDVPLDEAARRERRRELRAAERAATKARLSFEWGCMGEAVREQFPEAHSVIINSPDYYLHDDVVHFQIDEILDAEGNVLADRDSHEFEDDDYVFDFARPDAERAGHTIFEDEPIELDSNPWA